MTDSLPLDASIDSLIAERDRLLGERDRLLGERDYYRELYLKALEQCRKLELGLLGQKSERLSANQAQFVDGGG
jgi:hypothetical protein